MSVIAIALGLQSCKQKQPASETQLKAAEKVSSIKNDENAESSVNPDTIDLKYYRSLLSSEQLAELKELNQDLYLYHGNLVEWSDLEPSLSLTVSTNNRTNTYRGRIGGPDDIYAVPSTAQTLATANSAPFSTLFQHHE